MAYEVVKRIRGRDYRYQVEAYRDPQTGKARSRWTYLGRADAAAPVRPPARKPVRDTRARLLGAFERLLEQREYAAISAGSIAAEAGVAHGTFYRHFRDKRAAFVAAMEDLRRALAAGRPPLEGPLGDESAERERLGAWLRASLIAKPERRGIARAWFSLSAEDPELAELRRDRRKALFDELTSYLGALAANGYSAAEPAAAARAILIMLDGAIRRVVIDGEPLDAATLDTLVAMSQSAAFGRV